MKPSSPNGGFACLIGPGLITAVALVAYSDSFRVPFLFDDGGAIAANSTIRHLSPIMAVLRPPVGGLPVSGRPILNLSFALTYAFCGLSVWGYHAVNLAIHILASITLFSITQTTLRRFIDVARAFWIALAVALTWTAHPLQTEAVTYISQRAESLMGLFYLFTLFCFIRYAGREKRTLWGWLSVGACLLGMGTKEVMASAPLIVLLYDRTFISGSFRKAWTCRWRYYTALGCTWLFLFSLLLYNGHRGGTVGFTSSVPWPVYALTQFRAIAHYLWLSIWPHPLVFYYGKAIESTGPGLMFDASVVMLLAAVTTIGLWRCSSIGFLGSWFFAILAPSSSVVPISTETIAEHRAYLPLAAVIVSVVLGLNALFKRRTAFVILALVPLAIFLTWKRNEDYRDSLTLWGDTVAKSPADPFARVNFGTALVQNGQLSEAIVQFESALHQTPDFAEAYFDLGNALFQFGKTSDAIICLQRSVSLKPNFVEARNNLGNALVRAGRPADAIAQFETLLEQKPDLAEVHYNLANLLTDSDRQLQAISHYQEAIRESPDFTEAYANLGSLFLRLGRDSEAIPQFEAALRRHPEFADVHNNLGIAFAHVGRLSDAIGQFELIIQMKPDDSNARENLERLLHATGRIHEAP